MIQIIFIYFQVLWEEREFTQRSWFFVLSYITFFNKRSLQETECKWFWRQWAHVLCDCDMEETMGVFWFCSHVGALWLDNKWWKNPFQCGDKSKSSVDIVFFAHQAPFYPGRSRMHKSKTHLILRKWLCLFWLHRLTCFNTEFRSRKKAQTQCCDHTSERLVLMVTICIGLFK